MTSRTIYHSNQPFDEEHMLGESLADMIDASVADYSDRPAFSVMLPAGQSATLSYREIGALSDAVAAYLLQDLGLAKGDVVALQSPNALAFPVVAFGVIKAGLVLTNINPLYTADEVHHQLTDSGARVLFVTDIFGDVVASSVAGTAVEHIIRMSLVDFFPPLQRAFLRFAMKRLKKLVPPFSAPVDDELMSVIVKGKAHLDAGFHLPDIVRGIKAENTVLYQYTGGTTGRSKGAELTNRNIVANISQASLHNRREGEKDGKNMLLILPLYHVYALAVGAINGLHNGVHIILAPSPRPISNLKLAFEYFDINILPGINTLFLALMNESWFRENPPSSLEICLSGAAPLAPETAKGWQELTGVDIHEGYGLTEATCAVIAQQVHQTPVRGTCGTPMPGTELRLVDDNGKDVPLGEAGEIWARGPQIMRGYLGNREATAETITENGWLKTGDIGMIGEDGLVRIVDRKKDMVIVSGFNVFPTDIEAVLVKMDGIADAAVTGAPDPGTGERLVAWVVAADDDSALDEAMIIAHCRKHLTGYKVPKDIRFIDELPKSPVGKVLRRELRDMTENRNKVGD